MKVGAFLHDTQDSPTTLSEIKRTHDWVNTSDFLGLYAYATQSGASAFDLEVGCDFWADASTRWLFGIDYGRTQPQALRFMCEKENSDVRIFDAEWVLQQKGFIPRRDFHAKLSILMNPPDDRFGMVVGSGNFSSNGLRKSVEGGAVLHAQSKNAYRDSIEVAVKHANELWELSIPAGSVLDQYEEIWNESIVDKADGEQEDDDSIGNLSKVFWIEAGYVTRNRGQNRPGNQIDLPRGMARYFGFSPAADLAANSVIGEITFESPVGDLVKRNLRLGNNLMEKITLPIPETHGFDLYDGKVLVFERFDDRVAMHALEADDFNTAFGSKLADVKQMGSGRRYGIIA